MARSRHLGSQKGLVIPGAGPGLRTLTVLAEEVVANKRRSALLVVAFFVVVAGAIGTIGFALLGGRAGLTVGAVVGAAGAAVVYWRSDAVVLSIAKARPATEEEFPRLHNVVEGLCAAAGLPKPRIFVADDPAPNACSTGRDPRHAALAVTTGLLEKLDRMELEGVIAHELSHVKSYDILPATLAVTILGSIGRLFPALGDRLMLAVATRGRELAADVHGVALTRYPPGLISALEKLRDDPTPRTSISRATAHLWIESPILDDSVDGPAARLEERIEALREL